MATRSFVDALNNITLIAAVVALVAGVLCLFLIRARDFESQHGGPTSQDRPNRGGKHRADKRHPVPVG